MTCLFSHHLCVRSQRPPPPEHGSSGPQVLSALTVSGTPAVKAGGPLLGASPLEACFYFSLPSRKVICPETTALLSGRVEVPRRPSALSSIYTVPRAGGQPSFPRAGVQPSLFLGSDGSPEPSGLATAGFTQPDPWNLQSFLTWFLRSSFLWGGWPQGSPQGLLPHGRCL